MSTIALNETLEIIASSDLENASILFENYKEMLHTSTDDPARQRYIVLRNTAVQRITELSV